LYLIPSRVFSLLASFASSLSLMGGVFVLETRGSPIGTPGMEPLGGRGVIVEYCRAPPKRITLNAGKGGCVGRGRNGTLQIIDRLSGLTRKHSVARKVALCCCWIILSTNCIRL